MSRQAIESSTARAGGLRSRSLHLPDQGRRTAAFAARWGLNLALAVVWLSFAKEHLVFWASTGDFRGVGAMAMETLVAVLFLTRRSTLETSRAPVAWAATVVGAFAPMLMRPVGGAGGGIAALVAQLIGAAFVCVSLAFLGRSFGLVAANRGIVAAGPYRLVRHPTYLGYLVVQVAYVVENPSTRNAAVVLFATLGQLVRIRYEEAVLSRDPAYAAYKSRVRFRLMPRVY